MYEHTRAQPAQQCQEIKALTWNITLTCEQSMAEYWPLSSEESVEARLCIPFPRSLFSETPRK